MCTSTNSNINSNSNSNSSSIVEVPRRTPPSATTAAAAPAAHSFHLYAKPQNLTPERCERIVKYARKRLRGDHDHDTKTNANTNTNTNTKTNTNTSPAPVPVPAPSDVTILNHSQIELGKLLGKGAFSSVYEIKAIRKNTTNDAEPKPGREAPAADTTTNMVVKFLRTKLYDNHGLFAASACDLVKEGQILATLHHPNVLALYGMSSTDGVTAYQHGYHDAYFLILERLQGTLQTKIDAWRVQHRRWYDMYQTEATATRRHASTTTTVDDEEEPPQHRHPSSGEGVSSWRKRIATFKKLRSSPETMTVVSPSSSSSSSSSSSNDDVVENDTASDTNTSSDDAVDEDFYEEDSIIYRGMNRNSTATTSKADQNKNSKLAMIRASIREMVEEKVDAAIALGEAIAYLHAQRVVHRDLKPDNIGFDPHGVLKVFDFDIARVAPPPTTTQYTAAYDPDETFRMTGRVGSPRYMSPECAKKEDYNLTTDVYSYGLLCHQILTLEKPYDDIHDDDHDEYVFHRHVRPHIPQALPVPTQQMLFRSWAPILAFRPTCAKFCDLLKQDRTAIIQNGVPSSSSSVSTSMAYVSSCTFASVSDCNVVAATTATVAVATADVNKKAKKNKNSNKKMNKKLLSSFRQLLLGSGSGDKKKPLDGKSLNGTGGVPIPKILSSPTLGRQNSSNALAA